MSAWQPIPAQVGSNTCSSSSSSNAEARSHPGSASSARSRAISAATRCCTSHARTAACSVPAACTSE
eukprot:3019969-Prymnesium_polylepis.1